MTTLLADMSMVRPYPATASEISPKTGRGFFPGRMGVAGQSGLPRRPVMVVGQDFDEYESWKKTPAGDETGATWDELLKVLREAGIALESCFFTNVLMGVRIVQVQPGKEPSNSGPSPALDDAAFVGRCLEFLGRQIEVMRPSVVVLLGAPAACVVATWLGLHPFRRPGVKASTWLAGWKEIDAAGLQWVRGVRSPRGDGVELSVACAIHPALRKSNLRHRSWAARGLAGEAADREIWKEVAREFERLRGVEG
ncbi:MAG: hypothetical protein NTV94_09395 [Planctomycetota bacterium]|nr:hypothetical protein [Planctomycetota bacterium]